VHNEGHLVREDGSDVFTRVIWGGVWIWRVDEM
jgi:hypothetical protein